MELIKQILKHENIKYNNIEKSNSGFTNAVYFVDKKYVIKILTGNTKQEKLEKEISFYKNVKLEFIPKFIASGSIENNMYLIIEYIDGPTLYNIWHTLNKNQKEDIVKQICNILKTFHQTNYDFLDKKFIQPNWQQKWLNSFYLNIDILNQKGFNTTHLKHFANTHLLKIMEQNKPCLIYNDAHFDNFILHKNTLKLIDFDRVIACSLDYELLIISLMLDSPAKFANENDEQYVDIKDYSFVNGYLKKYYPDLFNFDYLEDRLFVYKFIYKLGQAYEYNHNDWIETELKCFEEYFKEVL